eukprot:TRINITY_DN5822_c0_g3_i1.p1 TRINITY_DN5822_c0_g3~~TRINITY_DN5822_c0_g3_i1.p1  ORF type:complete len:1020 (+),score=264.56 TRINITY_DN5822_c0_g3_i1:21-3080(+)
MSDSVEASAEVSHSEGSAKLNERPEPVVEEALEAAGDTTANTAADSDAKREIETPAIVVTAATEVEKIAIEDEKSAAEAIEKSENSKEHLATSQSKEESDSTSSKEVPVAPKENISPSDSNEINLPESTTLSTSAQTAPVKERLIEDGGMDFKQLRKMMEKKKGTGAPSASTDSISASMNSSRVPPIKIPDSGSNSSAEALTAPSIKEPTTMKDAKMQRKRAIPVKFQVKWFHPVYKQNNPVVLEFKPDRLTVNSHGGYFDIFNAKTLPVPIMLYLKKGSDVGFFFTPGDKRKSDRCALFFARSKKQRALIFSYFYIEWRKRAEAAKLIPSPANSEAYLRQLKKAEEEALRVLKQYLIDAGASIEGLLDENGNVQEPDTPRDAADFGGPGGPAPPPPPPPPPPPEFKDDSIIHVHWDRLQKVDDSTLWAEIASLAGELGLLDKQAFIEAFTKRAKKAGDDKKKALPQEDVVSFLKPNRSRNFLIILKRSEIKSFTIDALVQKIANFDPVIFENRDLVDTMLSYSNQDNGFTCFPTQTDIKVINEYLAEGGELAKLGAVDRAFLKLAKIPDLEERFVLRRFIFIYDERKPDIDKSFAFVEKAVNVIRHSTQFKKVLATIMQLVAILDHRPMKGFKLASISKLQTVKPGDVSLFDWIAEYLEKTSLKNFHEELECLKEAKDVALQELSLEVNQWNISLSTMREYLENHPTSTMVPFIKKFLAENQKPIESLIERLGKVMENQAEVCKWIGEDAAARERVFGIIYSFGQSFKSYYANRELQEKQKRERQERAKTSKKLKIRVRDDFMKRVTDDGQELPVDTYNPDDVSVSENVAPKKENKSSSRKGSKDSLKGSKENLKNSRGSNKSLKVPEGDKDSNDIVGKNDPELKSAMRDPRQKGLKKGVSVSFRGSSVEKLEAEGKKKDEKESTDKSSKKKSGNKAQTIANKTGQKFAALFKNKKSKSKKKNKGVAEDKPAEADVKVEVDASGKRDELKKSKDKSSKKESKSAKKVPKEKKSKPKKK